MFKKNYKKNKPSQLRPFNTPRAHTQLGADEFGTEKQSCEHGGFRKLSVV